MSNTTPALDKADESRQRLLLTKLDFFGVLRELKLLTVSKWK
jgi:hypothetical protein